MNKKGAMKGTPRPGPSSCPNAEKYCFVTTDDKVLGMDGEK